MIGGDIMSEINIKISELDAAITNLQSLKSACDGINTIAPTTVGGGKTVNEIENIASVYKSLNTHVGDMISNTIYFMQNIRASFITSDSNAAGKIGGK